MVNKKVSRESQFLYGGFSFQKLLLKQPIFTKKLRRQNVLYRQEPLFNEIGQLGRQDDPFVTVKSLEMSEM